MQVIKHIVNTFDVVLSVKNCTDCAENDSVRERENIAYHHVHVI